MLWAVLVMPVASCGLDGLSLRRLRTGFIVEKHDLSPLNRWCHQTESNTEKSLRCYINIK